MASSEERIIFLREYDEIPDDYNGQIVWEYDGKEYARRWYKNGRLHRDNDLPAVIINGGQKQWMQKGLPHRTSGPAVEYADGSVEWWFEGQIHRLSGPAVCGEDENYVYGEGYWLWGKKVSEAEWQAEKNLFEITHTSVRPGKRRRLSSLATIRDI